MDAGPLVPEITPAEIYQFDSDEYDSDAEKDDLDDGEYDQLVEEAEHGLGEEQVKQILDELKERGIVNFLRDYLSSAVNEEVPSLRKLLLSFGIVPPVTLRRPSTPSLALLPYTKLALSRLLRRRTSLTHLNTVSDAVELLRNAKNIIVLSGAGISTSCGIPDFRSAGGLYAQLRDKEQWELDDPQQMFDIHFFKEHPEVFYSFAKQIYPSNSVPSPCHRWIKLLEDRGVLLRNYTQNIDTLESLAGVTKVLQCHGSFATASCLRCKRQSPGRTIEHHIISSQIPFCGPCRLELDDIKSSKALRRKAKTKGKEKVPDWHENSSQEETDEWEGGEPGIIKPDITFFGQALDSQFDQYLYEDRDKVDLLVIMGTSLKVAPVSEVLTHIPHSVPQIFINMTPITHVRPDICLLGDADSIVTYLSHELDWRIPPPPTVLTRLSDGSTPESENPLKVGRSLVRPEDVRWVSGTDDCSHIHVLSTRHNVQTLSEQVSLTKSEGISKQSSVVTDNAVNHRASRQRGLTPRTLVAEADEGDGYTSDDEDEDGDRPSKRTRMES